LVTALVTLRIPGTDDVTQSKKDSRSFTTGLARSGMVRAGGPLGLKEEVPTTSYLVLITWMVAPDHDGFQGYGVTIMFSDASGNPEEVLKVLVVERFETPEAIIAARRDIVFNLKGQGMYKILNHWSDYRATREFFAWELGEREVI
jgi:hypothetical protein